MKIRGVPVPIKQYLMKQLKLFFHLNYLKLYI